MPEELFEQAKQEGKLVLLDFGAEWCSTCKPVEAMLENDLAPKWAHKLILVKVDVHQRPDLAERYRILSVPTVILCTADEQTLWRKSGTIKREEVEAALQQ